MLIADSLKDRQTAITVPQLAKMLTLKQTTALQDGRSHPCHRTTLYTDATSRPMGNESVQGQGTFLRRGRSNQVWRAFAPGR
jgi:hypothetical protein